MYVADDETIYGGDLPAPTLALPRKSAAKTDPEATLPDGTAPAEASSSGKSGSTDAAERTSYAAEAQEIGVLFRHRFRMRKYGLAPKRRLRLADGVGVSTGGGQQARRYIVLVKEVDETNGAMVIGWIDSAARKAQVRSFERVSQQYYARFKKPFDMTEDTYGQAAGELRDFLVVNNMRPEEVGLDPALAPPPRGLSLRTLIILGLVLVVLGAGLGYALRGS